MKNNEIVKNIGAVGCRNLVETEINDAKVRMKLIANLGEERAEELALALLEGHQLMLVVKPNSAKATTVSEALDHALKTTPKADLAPKARKRVHTSLKLSPSVQLTYDLLKKQDAPITMKEMYKMHHKAGDKCTPGALGQRLEQLRKAKVLGRKLREGSNVEKVYFIIEE